LVELEEGYVLFTIHFSLFILPIMYARQKLGMP
jgi:hypothetical protein